MKQKTNLTMPASTSGVQIFNLSDALAQFRAQLEQEAGAPASRIETTAGFVLDDLVAFLGFGPTLRAKILGPQTITAVDAFLDSRVELIQ